MAQESEKGRASVHSPLPLVGLLRRQPEVQVLRVGRAGRRCCSRVPLYRQLRQATPTSAKRAGLGSGPAPLASRLAIKAPPCPGPGHALTQPAPNLS